MTIATSTVLKFDTPFQSPANDAGWRRPPLRQPIRISRTSRNSAEPHKAPPQFPDDTALLNGLVSRHPAAWNQLVVRFGPVVERVVASALGVDFELCDVIQEVFVHVLAHIHQLRDPQALRSWITTVAVFTALGHIRRRRRGRWICFLAPEDVPEVCEITASHEARSLLRSIYRVLEQLRSPERTAFSLRFIAGMELREVARASGVSVATVKRRLCRAESRFLAAARRDPALRERIERGLRWRP